MTVLLVACVLVPHYSVPHACIPHKDNISHSSGGAGDPAGTKWSLCWDSVAEKFMTTLVLFFIFLSYDLNINTTRILPVGDLHVKFNISL